MTIRAWIASSFDAGDFVFVLGLGGAGYGIWLIDPAWAYIIVGGVLVLAAYLGKIQTVLTTLILAVRGGIPKR